MRKEPKEVAAERKEEARAANAAARKELQAANDAKKKMKGKNKPSRRQRKKQLNIIEERKGGWSSLLTSRHSLCCKCDMHRRHPLSFVCKPAARRGPRAKPVCRFQLS